MSNQSKLIFKGLKVVAWIIFIGLCIETGSLIINFVFSLVRPEMVENLYHDMDLSAIRSRSSSAYYGVYSFMLAVVLFKTWLFQLVVRLVSTIDLAKPFNMRVSDQITKISYYTAAIGFLSHIARQFANGLMHRGYETAALNQFWGDSQAFILMAAVIYVIATIFKSGVEMQSENELTV